MNFHRPFLDRPDSITTDPFKTRHRGLPQPGRRLRLEPDLRAPESQPGGALHTLRVARHDPAVAGGWRPVQD